MNEKKEITIGRIIERQFLNEENSKEKEKKKGGEARTRERSPATAIRKEENLQLLVRGCPI